MVGRADTIQMMRSLGHNPATMAFADASPTATGINTADRTRVIEVPVPRLNSLWAVRIGQADFLNLLPAHPIRFRAFQTRLRSLSQTTLSLIEGQVGIIETTADRQPWFGEEVTWNQIYNWRHMTSVGLPKGDEASRGGVQDFIASERKLRRKLLSAQA